MSSVPSTTPTSSTSTSGSTTSSTSGFGSLTSADFMQMLIAELQDQDPTQPMTNADLLNQLSQMTQLQSNQQLSDAIQTLSSNQQLSTAASFIGQTVSGTDSNSNSVSGVVTQAFIQSGTAYVSVGGTQVPLANITSVGSGS
jgi:flagellar basal-body rod modification protein FlgD